MVWLAAWMRPILQMRNDLILDDLIQDDLIQEITIVDCRTYSCTRGTCHFRCLQGAISRDLLDLGIVTGARDTAQRDRGTLRPGTDSVSPRRKAGAAPRSPMAYLG